MRITYKQGWRDGYGQALADCEKEVERATANGARLAYIVLLERMRACKDGLELAGVMQEIEDALD